MKILIVCSGKPSNPAWSFEITRSYVYEQIESIRQTGEIEYDTYFIEGSGIKGYLKNYKAMVQKIKEYKPDLIHAHYGLSGLLANLQRKVPVITTFHGSDINEKSVRPFSYLASRLSKENIFVHPNMPKKINYKKKQHIIPCGIDMDIFTPINKELAREKIGLNKDEKYALFTGNFKNDVKNYPLAKKSIEKVQNSITLIELKGYTREEVCLLMNAVDFLLMTSFSEGSPMVIKEAMCCNCPIVSVDVGDVKEVVADTQGCYIVDYNAHEIAEAIEKVIVENQRTKGREKMEKYALENIALDVLNVYKKVMHK